MNEKLPFSNFPPSGESIVLDYSNPLYADLPEGRGLLFHQFADERDALLHYINLQAESLQVPIVAHGTDSNNLESILVHGLGGRLPEKGALARSKSVTNATMPDGLVGAYLFAKGLMGDKLQIRREEVDPTGDILHRYTMLSPAIPEIGLRMQIERYFTMRAQQVGKIYQDAYPVFLLYADMQGQCISNNPVVPSEAVFSGVLGSEELTAILVPQKYIDVTREFLTTFDSRIFPRPIEALELL